MGNSHASHQLVSIDGNSLTIDQINQVARCYSHVSMSESARKKVHECETKLRELASSEKPIYGVNTGLGIFSNRRIQFSQSIQLSRNLILSHAVAIGEPFPEDVVRAAMLIRANTLAKGYSGVRPELIDLLLEMLNCRIIPYIPDQGSLGSSGDLAPLSHLALVISDDPNTSDSIFTGKAWFRNQLMSGKEALKAAGLSPLILQAKEGLAIINGAAFAASLLALACDDSLVLLRIAEICASMSMEALLAASNALHPQLHEVRSHPGQIAVAKRIRNLLRSSDFIDTTDRVQDAYSIRCTPQVIGPVWDILSFVQSTISREINAATDNPLFFDSDVISGGNFHGEPIGLAADYLKIALAEVGAISERRIYRLIDEHTNEGLPPMLINNPDNIGLQSGLMMLQYSAASLVLENQVLASPASVLSLPTSAGQEDHNSNATLAARYLSKVIKNLYHILAIELLTSAHAIQLRLQEYPEKVLGVGTNAAFQWVRSQLPFREDDFPLSEDIQKMAGLLKRRELIQQVDGALN